ncbi:MAG: phosphoribosylformylglycinamidine synthase subunit PurS [Thermoanaerobaculia bacterium]
MKAKLEVFLKETVLDPQGKAIKEALEKLGFDKIVDLRVGKIFYVELDLEDREKAKEILEEAAEKLLCNKIIESYKIIL